MQHRRSCPVRDMIMRRYDPELLGAPLWCTTQQEGLWIQGVNVMILQRQVFVCASELTLDESLTNVAIKEAKENRTGTSPATRWRRPCMRVAVYLSIDQGELLRGHSSVEASGRKGRGSDDESSGAQLPKSKASVRKEVDSEEHHSATEADLPIAKEGMKMQGNR
ncbi:hypothetical protein BHM03_00059900 [Ensete ventricosum]|nr:hypothetical protein BHM03_00059900 [Ensete ventricosum]